MVRVRKYTFSQSAFFAGVSVVQNIPAITINFPFLTLLCIPERLSLFPYIFAGWELLLLNGDSIDEWVEAIENSLSIT
jgi:hypothetical protein